MSTDPNSVQTGRRSGRDRFLILTLVLLALGARFLPADHGLPRGYVPDAHIVRSALGMARDKNPVPPVGKYSTYPNLLPYMLLPVYAGHFGVGLARGEWKGMGEYRAHVLSHPEEPHYLARLLVAALGALTVWVVWRAALVAGMGPGAWAAAFLVATGLLHTHFSVQERPWVPLAGFLALAAWAAAHYQTTGKTRALILSGAAAGLAYATHQAGLLVLLICGLSWLIGPPKGTWPGFGRHIRLGVLTVLCFAVVGILIGHPYYLVHGRTPDAAVVGGGVAAVSLGGMSHEFGVSMEAFKRITTALVGYDPVLIVLAILGLPLALKRRGTRAAALWTILWAAYFLPHYNDHVRYLLPLVVLGALPAGLLVESLWRRGALARGSVLVALALPLAAQARLVQVLDRTDLRAEAEDRLLSEGFGARIAIDRYGPLVGLDEESLVRLAELRARQGGSLYTREKFRLERLRAGESGDDLAGIDGLFLEDLFGFDDRTGEVWLQEGLGEPSGPQHPLSQERIAEELERLGMTHLLLVEREAAGTLPHPLGGLVQGLEPEWVMSPASDADVETRLPLEMRCAWGALGKLERPGPRLSLYALPATKRR